MLETVHTKHLKNSHSQDQPYLVCHMPQFFQIILSYFDFIPRNYVKFYAKVVTDDSAESRMWNVIMNILILNK